MKTKNTKLKNTVKKIKTKTVDSKAASVTSRAIRSDIQNTSQSFTKSKTNRNFIIIFLLLLAFGIYYLLRNQLVVAVVGNKPIFRFEVINELEQAYGKDLIESLVAKKLILAEANKNNLISDDQIDSQIQDIKDSLASENKVFEDELLKENLTLEKLRESILLQNSVEKLLEGAYDVSQEEISEYYDNNKQFYGDDLELEDLSPTIENELKQQKYQEELKKLIDRLKDEYQVKYFFSY